MAGSWSNKDANGKPLTDGRLCYVITPTDPSMPPIYIYGIDKDEILEKAMRTVETAQSEIHRLRKPAVTPPAPPARVSDADVATATADLANPAKSSAAIKTLLKAGGLDLDKAQYQEQLKAAALIANQWETDHPEYPKGPRNDRLLAKLAAARAGGFHRLTEADLDAAFAEMKENEMIFESEDDSTVQPDGNRDSRTVRHATSYRRNALSSPEVPPARGESAQIKEWRNILENGTSRDLRNAIENIPGFKKWADELYAKTA